tara:strand:+ start:32 stop:421 length:390 start_codon:yes stop_codon:yes gene_type:complete
MKKSIYTFALLLIGAITIMSFSNKPIKKDNTTETYYYCVYNINHEIETLYISNVFSSTERPDDVSCSKYMENELDYNINNYRSTHLYSHEDKNFVYDDRLEGIEWAKDKVYKVVKFDVKCKNGRLYPKY